MLSTVSYTHLVTELRELALFFTLAARSDSASRNLAARLESSIGGIQRMLGDIRVHFRHFTDHSIEHSFRICDNIASILGQEKIDRLTSADLFLLVASALIHDIGMLVREDESAESEKRGIERATLLEHTRKHHPSRSLQLVLDERIPAALVDRSPRLRHWVGKIAEAHGYEHSRVAELPHDVTIDIEGSLRSRANPRFIAYCLRLGDLLDIGTSRVCPLLRSLSEPLNLLSKDHWDQYADIEIQNMRPGAEITIEGTCPTQSSERTLREWLKWLDEEIADANAVQNTDEEKYQLRLGKTVYKVTPRKISGAPAYEFLAFRFNLDERMVFERLFGKALYGRSDLAVRELLQNAIDAQRALILKDLSASPTWAASSDQDKRTALAEAVLHRSNNFAIRVRWWLDAENRQYISVVDRGIGMTRQVIERYLLKIGRSRWSEDLEASRLGMGNVSIGKFGIGFLSTLMIADEVVVDTKSCMPDEPGIRATVYGWHGYLGTEPSLRGEREHGTEIVLRLTEPCWPDPLSLAVRLCEIAPLIEFPIEFDARGSSYQVPRLQAGSSYRVSIGSGDSSAILFESGDRFKQKIWQGDSGVAQSFFNKSHEHMWVAQDGLTVGELGPPDEEQKESLEKRLLREQAVLVDLRGRDRVPLDLSRNLPEGGGISFWDKMSASIWDALGGDALSSPTARRYVSLLAEHRLFHSRGRAITIINKSSPTIRSEVAANISQVLLIDYDSSVTLNDFECACLLPTDAHHPQVNEARAYTKEAEHSRAQKAYARLNQDLRALLKTHAFLSRTPAGLLLHDQSDHGEFVGQFIGFRLSRRWCAIRSLHSHAFSLVPQAAVESLLELARRLSISLGNAYAAISHICLPVEKVTSSALSVTPFGRLLSAALTELTDLQDDFVEMTDIENNNWRGDPHDAQDNARYDRFFKIGEELNATLEREFPREELSQMQIPVFHESPLDEDIAVTRNAKGFVWRVLKMKAALNAHVPSWES